MDDKYVKLTDVKRKLRYIFKAYGVGNFVREKVKRTLDDLPYSAKGDLETTLEVTDVQPVVHGHWEECEIRGALTQSCSVCGDDCGVLYPYNFCPNCGAKMDGDENK